MWTWLSSQIVIARLVPRRRRRRGELDVAIFAENLKKNQNINIKFVILDLTKNHIIWKF